MVRCVADNEVMVWYWQKTAGCRLSLRSSAVISSQKYTPDKDLQSDDDQNTAAQYL